MSADVTIRVTLDVEANSNVEALLGAETLQKSRWVDRASLVAANGNAKSANVKLVSASPKVA